MNSTAAARIATPLRSKRALIALLTTVSVILLLDLGTKYAAFRWIGPDPVVLDASLTKELVRTAPQDLQLAIPEPARRTIVGIAPHLLEFKLMLNPGAVFGTGPGMRWVFVIFTLVAIAFCLYVFGKLTKATDWFTHSAIGCVAGGGLGNLYDRLVYGCVRDFIHPLPGVEWPFGWTILNRKEIWPYVSNVADAVLLIGIAILVVKLWRVDAHTDHADDSDEQPGKDATHQSSERIRKHDGMEGDEHAGRNPDSDSPKN